MLCLVALLATACNDDNVSDLQLSGDCMVTALQVDDYQGIVDLASRTINVNVPETYDASNMELKVLTLSDGASANIEIGERMDLTTPQMIRVTNGDVFLEWTIVVKHDEARIYSFKINDTYTGVINDDDKTISVFVPATLDITSLIPTITYSENATISPLSGMPTDFTNPVAYTVSNNTANATYTVTVTQIDKPSAVYVGLASSMDQLNIEEQTACQWMLENISNSLYVSFDDIKNEVVDLSECKVMWWHFHKDGGVDGKNAFEAAAPVAIETAYKLRDYYNNGGAFLFTRYATNMPAYIGAVANEGAPNNCWGQDEENAETVEEPWEFSIAGHTDHAMFQNLTMMDGVADHVYTCDAGYRITNSTAQWHIGTDWGGYDSHEAWRNLTGGIDLGHGGDEAVVVWEFPANNGKGGILCIGSGCYDWYTVGDANVQYHDNIAKMTLNAFNYLMK